MAIFEAEVDKLSLHELERMARSLNTVVQDVLVWLAKEATREAKSRAPVGPTGRVRSSIHAEAGAEPGVASDWFVTRLLERGFRAHRAWIPSLQRWVNIPGRPPKPGGYFLQPAVEDTIERKKRELEGRIVEKL